VNRKRGFLEWDATLFYTWFSNKIIPNYDKDPNKIYYDNIGESAVSRGISINVDADFTFPLKVNAGITLLDVFAVTKDSLGTKINTKQIHAPGFSGTFQLSYSWKQIGLTIDYTGQVYGPMRLPILPNDFRPEYSPWYALHNMQISKKISKRLEVYGGIKNMFNFLPQNPIMRWWDPFDKSAGNTATNPNGYTFDPSYNYAPMFGRRFFIGIRYTLK
jgi:outer membrane receptor for ferrienterochelin and colicins